MLSCGGRGLATSLSPAKGILPNVKLIKKFQKVILNRSRSKDLIRAIQEEEEEEGVNENIFTIWRLIFNAFNLTSEPCKPLGLFR
jgi:hypothetical protein